MDASTLNQTEIDYLYSLLNHQPSSQKEAWWVVMNEVMEQIVKQDIAPDRITPEFCSIISDTTLDPVVRDYAIQHLSIYLAASSTKAPSSTAPSTKSENWKLNTENSLKVLSEAIRTPGNQHNSIPGTAFMGLIEISNNPIHQGKIEEVFEELENYLTPLITGESSASLANRTSAINAVGLMQSEKYLPMIRKLITTEEKVNDSVKLSSIAALGDFYAPSSKPSHSSLHTSHSPPGSFSSTLSPFSSEDRQILDSIKSSDTKFKHAATAALNKIRGDGF